MGDVKKHLRVLPGDLRKSLRARSYGVVEARLIVAGQDSCKCRVISREIGRFVVRISRDDLSKVSLKSGCDYSLEVKSESEVLIDGSWVVASVRREEHASVIVFQLAHYDSLLPVFRLTHPEIFFRKSSFRIFDVAGADLDVTEVGQHFTEVKDFPRPVKCRIYHATGDFEAEFDFRSDAKNLKRLD